MFSRANNRADFQRLRSFWPVAVRAMRFHCSGELSTQNKAISVCSGVRSLGVVVPSPPRRLTSFTSAAYFFESKAYGGPGRNWVASFSMNGVTFPQPGAKAKVKGGVNLYSPGLVPCG